MIIGIAQNLQSRVKSNNNQCKISSFQQNTHKMKIILNGHALDLLDNSTLLNLIESQDLRGKRLAVEVNLEIIPKAEHANYILKDDDKVEIVHAIGGGSANNAGSNFALNSGIISPTVNNHLNKL